MHDSTEPSAPASKLRHPAVDNTDWLKAAAIILVAIDHFGYFFVENDAWWSVFGRLAAPTFFYLLGYARSRQVPFYWIILGIVLTLLDSSNNEWTWVAPNILLSFALIRLGRPYVSRAAQRAPWLSITVLSFVFVYLAPFSMQLFDYGTSGWLWALLGLCQRVFVDTSDTDGVGRVTRNREVRLVGGRPITVLVCAVAALLYVWQEQQAYSFSEEQLTVFAIGTVILSLLLLAYRRGESPIQPPRFIADALLFVGRRTLEIYAFQLAGSELLIKLAPDLSP